MSDRKMSDFVLFPWLQFTLVLKLRNFDFESHWNTLIYLDKKGVRFEYIHIYIYIYIFIEYIQNVWFCFISIVWVHFSRLKVIEIVLYNLIKKISCQIEYVPWKDLWFISFSLYSLTSVIKLRNFNFKGH